MKHLQAVSRNTPLRIVPVVGGISQQKQMRLLSRRPDIVVATPGRFWELMEENVPYARNLSHLKCASYQSLLPAIILS